MTKRRGDMATRGHGEKELPDHVSASPRRAVSPSSHTSSPLITLLTDFGTEDYFVGAVKGVIHGANPHARIVDITHDIPPHDIEAAAFTMLAACPYFPAGTIHLAVVDPGVGSSRRAILVKTREQLFVGPDNGIFSYVCEDSAASGGTIEVIHLTNSKYFRQPVSATFNGRDIFAPVAAALSLGVKPAALGTRIDDFVRLPPLKPTISRNGQIKARIIHIDRFGNCITNITANELTAPMIADGAKLRVEGTVVKSFHNFFAEDDSGSVFAIWGSAGFLEIAVANNSAAKLLKAKRGDPVVIQNRER